jgi:hypothetical protein
MFVIENSKNNEMFKNTHPSLKNLFAGGNTGKFC